MRILFLLLCLLITTATTAQQQLLSATNAAVLADGETYSWALGDVFANGQAGSQVAVVVTGTEHFTPFQTALDVSLLGNPTNEQINIQFSEPIAIQYRLLAADGKLLKTAVYDRPQLNCQINIEALPAQVYFLQIVTLDGKSGRTLRVVKQ